MKDIIIIGAGDFTKKVIRLIQQENVYRIAGYVNPDDCGEIFGVKYLGTDMDVLRMFIRNPGNAVLGLAGNMKIRDRRDEIISKLKGINFNFPVIKSGDAIIDKSVVMNEGVLIFNGAYIDFEVKIGKYSVINLFSLIGHNVEIGKNTIVSPKCAVGGGTIIGDNCFIGMHSTINPYLKITDDVIIGAGSMVTHDIPESGTYAGNPVKKIK